MPKNNNQMHWVHLTIQATYKPGDLPPEGYLAWHEWADVQRKAKIKQVACPTCSLWRTPQELSTKQREWTCCTSKGEIITFSEFICSKCVEKETAL